MKSGYKIGAFVVFLLISAIVCALQIKVESYLPEQRNLARELGVNIEDYPYPDKFPTGYFSFVLKSGMSIKEVHSLIRGYTSVFRCDKAFEEIYYYFSNNDSKALRFIVYYDMDFKYDELGTEDENSRTILLDGCAPGLFEE